MHYNDNALIHSFPSRFLNRIRFFMKWFIHRYTIGWSVQMAIPANRQNKVFLNDRREIAFANEMKKSNQFSPKLYE